MSDVPIIDFRALFDVFPNDPSDPDNSSVRQLRESLHRVLAERAPDTLALIPYRVPRQTAEGIVVEDRYWSATPPLR